jgi:hypothetical protein
VSIIIVAPPADLPRLLASRGPEEYQGVRLVGDDVLSDGRHSRAALRYRAFQRVLNETVPGSFSHVVACDAADVLWQGSVQTEWVADQDVVFSLEAPQTLAGEVHNARWIEILGSDPSRYDGKAVLREIGHHVVSCSGFHLAGFSGFRRYLTTFNKLMDELPVETEKNVGVDQGLHNYILRKEWANDSRVVILSHLESPVYTAGFVGPGEFHLDRQGRLTHCKGTPPVVHQLNRHKEVWAIVREMAERRVVTAAMREQLGRAQAVAPRPGRFHDETCQEMDLALHCALPLLPAAGMRLCGERETVD